MAAFNKNLPTDEKAEAKKLDPDAPASLLRMDPQKGRPIRKPTMFDLELGDDAVEPGQLQIHIRHALEQMARKCLAQGTTLLLTEIASQPLRAIVRARKLEAFGGREHLAKTLDLALDRAESIVG